MITTGIKVGDIIADPSKLPVRENGCSAHARAQIWLRFFALWVACASRGTAARRSTRTPSSARTGSSGWSARRAPGCARTPWSRSCAPPVAIILHACARCTRADARARAPRRRGILPLGTSRKDWNFSLQDKRVLNFENEVSDTDNIKQASARAADAAHARLVACARVRVAWLLCAHSADAACLRAVAAQDISIDVYGRTDETAEAKAK
jgi:hypothetical protein